MISWDATVVAGHPGGRWGSGLPQQAGPRRLRAQRGRPRLRHPQPGGARGAGGDGHLGGLRARGGAELYLLRGRDHDGRAGQSRESRSGQVSPRHARRGAAAGQRAAHRGGAVGLGHAVAGERGPRSRLRVRPGEEDPDLDRHRHPGAGGARHRQCQGREDHLRGGLRYRRESRRRPLPGGRLAPLRPLQLDQGEGHRRQGRAGAEELRHLPGPPHERPARRRRGARRPEHRVSHRRGRARRDHHRARAVQRHFRRHRRAGPAGAAPARPRPPRHSAEGLTSSGAGTGSRPRPRRGTLGPCRIRAGPPSSWWTTSPRCARSSSTSSARRGGG